MATFKTSVTSFSSFSSRLESCHTPLLGDQAGFASGCPRQLTPGFMRNRGFTYIKSDPSCPLVVDLGVGSLVL